MYSKEIKGSWFGVTIPEWLRAFDCRSSEDDIAPRTPWGSYLWSSERAAVDLGLRAEGVYNDTTPVGCSTYIDARTAPEEELRRQVENMVAEATRLREEYLEGKKFPDTEGQGGSCLYMPVAVCLSNFGWSVLADRTQGIVRRFGYNATPKRTKKGSVR